MEKAIIKLRDTYKVKYGIKLTRNEKRKGQKELEFFEAKVEPLIEEFEKELFNEDSMNYELLYNSYLAEITQLCEACNDIKFKVIEVDNYFFSETYKPLEVGC